MVGWWEEEGGGGGRGGWGVGRFIEMPAGLGLRQNTLLHTLQRVATPPNLSFWGLGVVFVGVLEFNTTRSGRILSRRSAAEVGKSLLEVENYYSD